MDRRAGGHPERATVMAALTTVLPLSPRATRQHRGRFMGTLQASPAYRAARMATTTEEKMSGLRVVVRVKGAPPANSGKPTPLSGGNKDT